MIITHPPAGLPDLGDLVRRAGHERSFPNGGRGQADPNPSSRARLSPAKRFSTGALKWTLKALRPRWEST